MDQEGIDSDVEGGSPHREVEDSKEEKFRDLHMEGSYTERNYHNYK